MREKKLVLKEGGGRRMCRKEKRKRESMRGYKKGHMESKGLGEEGYELSLFSN